MFKPLQNEVDSWINANGGYFCELTNLANLMEEVGEVARLISRTYGEQSFKNKRPTNIKSEIAGELADVLFIVVCLANQLDICLEDAFKMTINKNTQRDKQRHINNQSLNPRKLGEPID